MDCIIGIDISSTKVKTALISLKGEILASTSTPYEVIDDNADGFAKHIDAEDIWNKTVAGIKQLIQRKTIEPNEILAITSDSIRLGTILIDADGMPIYCGTNMDVRGMDSGWMIDDAISEEELYQTTAHLPSIVFDIARILWFKDNDEENFYRIDKVAMLDDWIVYKLSGKLVSDPAIESESQLLNIKTKEWAKELIEKFEFNLDWFPPLVESGTKIGEINPDLAKELGLSPKTIIVKSGADTQTTLLGMGCKKHGDIGIILGSTAPVDMILENSIIDPKCNLWTCAYTIPGQWMLESNTGFTGKVYDWFKQAFLKDLNPNLDELVASYLRNTKPGGNFTFAFTGPERMNFKNQTSMKQSAFVFPPQGTLGSMPVDRQTFTRSLLENLGFGICDNVEALKELEPRINEIYCGGGMANLKEFVQIIANILDHEILVPKMKDTAYLGHLINCTVALKRSKDHSDAISKFTLHDQIKPEPEFVTKYKELFNQWKNYKAKIDKI